MKILKNTIIAVMMLGLIFPTMVNAEDETQITSGTYYQLGQYNGNPIVWRAVVSNDENGILMVSDKILCYKIFDPADSDGLGGRGAPSGTNFWEDATMRIWLNSIADSGKVEWINNHIPSENRVFYRPFFHKGKYPYADEKGFLNNDNFTIREKSLIKTVSHWQALARGMGSMSENGLRKPFYPTIVQAPNSMYEKTVYTYKIEDMDKAYYGAMYRVTDTMITLDEKQLWNVLQQLGTVTAANAKSVVASDEMNEGIYWLRTPEGERVITTATGEEGYGLENVNLNELGVRPAFYLNEDNIQILSGSGTETDPYVITGSEQVETPVFCNGVQLQFDQQPIEENDRLLVPVRAIFESLGAEVTYDDGDGVITANNGERTVVMQIDNDQMGNGTEVFTLEVAPKLVGDRTVVPLRAVSEAFDCKVDYIEDLNRVVIDPPQPEDTDEGHWQSDWDIVINGKGKK